MLGTEKILRAVAAGLEAVGALRRRSLLERAEASGRAAFTLQGALPPGRSKNELQSRITSMQSHSIGRPVAAVTAIGLTLLLATNAVADAGPTPALSASPRPTVVLVHGVPARRVGLGRRDRQAPD
jgi:hypothetical protein